MELCDLLNFFFGYIWLHVFQVIHRFFDLVFKVGFFDFTVDFFDTLDRLLSLATFKIRVDLFTFFRMIRFAKDCTRYFVCVKVAFCRLNDFMTGNSSLRSNFDGE